MIALVLLAAALAGPAGGPTPQEPGFQGVLDRSKVRWPEFPRKVLAFYYPWYGNPEHSGEWVHWADVDADRHTIASSTHYPALGAYDSNDPEVVARHCEWANQAGLDGFISSWWRQDDFHDRALPLLLDTAKKNGIEVTIYYELVSTPRKPEAAIADFLYILNRYGAHPAWLKAHGKPVIFVYGRALGQLSMEQWAHVIKETNRRYLPGVFLVADSLSRGAARVFDGVHTYNTCAALAGKKPGEIAPAVERIFADAMRSAGSYGRLSCVTVVPGYDDTKIRKPGILTERFDGDSFERQWDAAIALSPDWVLITSFNEWHEGSEIEPSVEFGDKYIRLSGKNAQRFKNSPKRPANAEPGTSLTKEKLDALRAALSSLPIALLPNAQSEAAFWLSDIGAPLTSLTWEQVAESLDAKRFPILLYAGPERYTQTAKSHGDVDRALLRYLRDGGCLVLMSNEPFPFFYNERREAVSAAAKFGVPIGGAGSGRPPGGFERPPAGAGLEFLRAHDSLENLASRFPFPASGDRRWRPFLGRGLPAGDVYVPLIELRDGEGRWWGDAAAFIEHRESAPKGGRALYVWFRLLDIPQGEAVLCDLFSFLAGELHKNECP